MHERGSLMPSAKATRYRELWMNLDSLRRAPPKQRLGGQTPTKRNQAMIDQAERIESVFAAALQQPPQERVAFLNQECADNPVLRGRVEALLKAHDQAGSFLKDPPARPQATEGYELITERPGTVLGPYKLMEQIG